MFDQSFYEFAPKQFPSIESHRSRLMLCSFEDGISAKLRLRHLCIEIKIDINGWCEGSLHV
jgi:hypothetical protein